MANTTRQRPQRRIDVAGLISAVVGVAFAIVSYYLIVNANINPLVIVPSIVTATLGFANLTKLEAPRYNF